jgi:hypothetical protein
MLKTWDWLWQLLKTIWGCQRKFNWWRMVARSQSPQIIDCSIFRATPIICSMWGQHRKCKLLPGVWKKLFQPSWLDTFSLMKFSCWFRVVLMRSTCETSKTKRSIMGGSCLKTHPTFRNYGKFWQTTVNKRKKSSYRSAQAQIDPLCLGLSICILISALRSNKWAQLQRPGTQHQAHAPTC